MQPQRPFPDLLDASIINELKNCPEHFRKTYVEDWKPRGLSVHLHAGASFARGLEVARTAFYVDNLSAEDAVAKGLGALLTAYGDFECPADSAKSANRMAGALEYYFDNYPLSWSDSVPVMYANKRAIEFSFAHPLPIAHPVSGDPLLYCGRMDAVISYAGGTYICDEKTTTQLGASWGRQWDLRAQFTGYTWGCAQSGIKVNGALIRGVSILKTKYDKAESLTYRPQWMIDQWYDELLEWIQEAIMAWKSGKWKHNYGEACASYGGCAFQKCCTMQDETPWLETYFERRKWNPLLRIETPA